MIFSLLTKLMFQANQLGSLSRKSILVSLNIWMFSKCSLSLPHHINEPFALLTSSPSHGCGETRAHAQSWNPGGHFGLR